MAKLKTKDKKAMRHEVKKRLEFLEHDLSSAGWATALKDTMKNWRGTVKRAWLSNNDQPCPGIAPTQYER